MCVYIYIYIYMVDRNNGVRGNVKRRLPELSSFPPYGNFMSPFTIVIIVNHLLFSRVG
jgi:hypothetical protein